MRGDRKLTWSIVRAIRACDPLRSNADIAKEFGITPGHVSHVMNGLIWKERGYTPPERRKRAKLTWKEVAEIRTSTWTLQRLADAYEVSTVCIWNVRTNKTWRGDALTPEPTWSI